MNLDSRLTNINAFFFNILYCGIKDISQHARLLHIMAKICMQNALNIERFGWLHFAHGNAGEVECMSDLHGNCMQNYDAVLTWISRLPRLTVLYLGFLRGINYMVESLRNKSMSTAHQEDETIKQQRLLNLWNPLFSTGCRKESAALPNLREIHFLDESDTVGKYFVTLVEARQQAAMPMVLKQAEFVTYAEERLFRRNSSLGGWESLAGESKRVGMPTKFFDLLVLVR